MDHIDFGQILRQGFATPARPSGMRANRDPVAGRLLGTEHAHFLVPAGCGEQFSLTGNRCLLALASERAPLKKLDRLRKGVDLLVQAHHLSFERVHVVRQGGQLRCHAAEAIMRQ